jgi:aminoglycoside 3-N-acetyltransferase
MGEEKATSPAPKDGAWARLYDEDATILLVGVGLNRCTYIHAVDEMIELGGRLCGPIPLTVKGYRGEEYHLSFRKHGKTGSENFGLYKKAFEHLRVISYGKLGDAEVIKVNARALTEAVRLIWQRASFDFLIENREIPEEFYL